ncbi:hypothetical protein OAM16_01730 [Candidatus Pelagibacter sp.]|nr:hypothetical protein [Candidatus Pelagibacter sp.]MDC1497322.1 hypothetical protein [Pelagibacteraceae bacterium]
MDEDISIINSNTRNEKVRNFFIKNKVRIISTLLTTVIVLIGAYSIDKYKTNQRIEISDKYNSTTLTYSENSKDNTVKDLVEIINEKDPTYSPLSLYFIIDNKLISDQGELNSYFDILIQKTSLDEEMKNLVIYKKALFNADQADEGKLLSILNPLINSKSVWKSHALYLMAEYFYSKDQKQKSKEFFNQIIGLENSNSDIKRQAEKRLSRDLSE